MFETIPGGLASMTCDRRTCSSVMVEEPARLKLRLLALNWHRVPPTEFSLALWYCPDCVVVAEELGPAPLGQP